jgi:glyceraldehyde 3-phosphate dehydrogenase
MTVKVAINGFGRIGRNILRAIVESGRKDIQVVAINDLGPVETNAHLLRYDSVHGRFPHEVKVAGDTIDVGMGKIKVTAIRNPAELPHKANAPASSPRETRRRRISTPAPGGCSSRRPARARI